MSQPAWMSLSEVAEHTSTSLSTVRRWIADGELKAHRLGKRTIRVSAESLDSFISEIDPATFGTNDLDG